MSNLIRRRSSPPTLLSNLQEEINQLFYPFMNQRIGGINGDVLAGDWSPRIDVKEEPNQYIVHADIPGVKPEDVEVSMDGDTLTIKGHKESAQEEKSEGYLRIERSSGTFLRQFTLATTVDADKIKATAKNGVLTLIIPKSSSSRSHKISVRAEN